MNQASEPLPGPQPHASDGESTRSLMAERPRSVRVLWLRRSATAILGLATIIIAVILGIWFFEIDFGDSSRRFIEVYAAEHRQIDLRFPGAEYRPLKSIRTPDSGYDFSAADLANYEDDLKQRLKDRPGDSQSLFALAEICLVRMQPLQAIDILERLRLFSPKDPRVLGALAYGNYLRARASGEKRDLLRSFDLFERALEVSPHDPVLLFNAGVVAQRAGFLKRAGECYRRFLELESNSGWSEEVRRHMRELHLQTEP